uniref:Uncharacterized protein n=1 Tax=Mesocestoides corti TaxID=53468 RepID=A0A5K3EEW1_MESCO
MHSTRTLIFYVLYRVKRKWSQTVPLFGTAPRSNASCYYRFAIRQFSTRKVFDHPPARQHVTTPLDVLVLWRNANAIRPLGVQLATVRCRVPMLGGLHRRTLESPSGSA